LSSVLLESSIDLAVQKSEVTRLAVSEGVFSSNLVEETVSWLYTSLHHKYFGLFSTEKIAKHVNLLLAARKVAEATKSRTLEFKIEEVDSAFYVCSLDMATAHRTEQFVSDYLEKYRTPEKAVSVIFLSSTTSAPISSLGGVSLGFYVVEFSDFVAAPSNLAELADEDDLMEISSQKFLRSKTPAGLHMYQELITRVMASRSTVCEVVPATAVSAGESGYVVEFAVYETGIKNYLKELNEIFRSLKIQPRRFYLESFANAITTYTVYFDSLVSGNASQIPSVLQSLSDTLRFIPHFKQTPGRSALVWDLVMSGRIKPEQCIYMLALVKFCFSFFPRESPEYVDLAKLLKSDEVALTKLEELHRQAVSERLTSEKIYETFIKYVDLTTVAFADFASIAKGEKTPFWNSQLEQQINELSGVVSSLDRKILKTMIQFNANLLLTNFYKQDTAPSAMAFRFKPEILANRPKVLYPELPYGVYLIMGRGFYGFHVRFRDVARGGIRLIRSRDRLTYEKNAASLFDETYNLAFTQQQKNKDIPEGGSKGTILLDSDWATPMSQTQTRNSYFKYIDALLDCMLAGSAGAAVTGSGRLAGSGISSHLPKQEILFFGPDENTGDLSDLGALRGKERGYKYWKALTTGKSTSLGGVPHDVYGMTTHGIHRYVLELFRVLGVDETTVTKFQTGGPDGDLGSNEILVSKDKTVGILDGSGVAYDPNGLDRPELVRLAKHRLAIVNFDRKKLGAGGFIVSVEEKDITLPDGSVWKNGAELRDKFHLLDFATADLFVPCGGRPQAVNGKNVNRLFKDGKCKFKYIVEGANLFFNDDARRVLEAAGVHLFKDASANKGGVTSSSLEVFAALAMENKLHDQLLTVSADGEVPEFYRAYVKEIKRVIAKNAELEFQAIWNANQFGTEPMTKVEATKVLSQKINNLADYISSVLDMDSDLAQKILRLAIPPLLIEGCGFENILARCPRNYLTAVAAVYVASRYIYRYGISASEFNFYEFMRSIELGVYCEMAHQPSVLQAGIASSEKSSSPSLSPVSLPRDQHQAPFKPRTDGLSFAPILL